PEELQAIEQVRKASYFEGIRKESDQEWNPAFSFLAMTVKKGKKKETRCIAEEWNRVYLKGSLPHESLDKEISPQSYLDCRRSDWTIGDKKQKGYAVLQPDDSNLCKEVENRVKSKFSGKLITTEEIGEEFAVLYKEKLKTYLSENLKDKKAFQNMTEPQREKAINLLRYQLQDLAHQGLFSMPLPVTDLKKQPIILNTIMDRYQPRGYQHVEGTNLFPSMTQEQTYQISIKGDQLVLTGTQKFNIKDTAYNTTKGFDILTV